jgi:hypothetical protein
MGSVHVDAFENKCEEINVDPTGVALIMSDIKMFYMLDNFLQKIMVFSVIRAV